MAESDQGRAVSAPLPLGHSRQTCKLVVCLWARCERYPEPQFVGAVAESLRDAWFEESERLREAAEAWFEDFDDAHGWEFWTTDELIQCNPLRELEATRNA
jgi:hypothetical protein